jgi:plasmid maintenance system antidote protein VapI
MAVTVPGAADLRAELARRRLPIFRVAARLDVHPTTLGKVLNERLPLSPELASRIASAIEAEARGR